MPENRPKATILDVKDILSGEQGEVWATLGGRRMCMMQVKNIEVNVSYNKEKVPILGKRGKGNRKTGEEYTGSMTVYYITSAFRELAQQYKNTGEDFYFDMQIINEDKTTRTGAQEVTLIDVNVDTMVLAKLDADNSVLEEDMDFTFEDYRIDTPFKELPGLYVD